MDDAILPPSWLPRTTAERRSLARSVGPHSPGPKAATARDLPVQPLLGSCSGEWRRSGGANLRWEFPEMKGFSPRNLKYMRRFAEV